MNKSTKAGIAGFLFALTATIAGCVLGMVGCEMVTGGMCSMCASTGLLLSDGSGPRAGAR